MVGTGRVGVGADRQERQDGPELPHQPTGAVGVHAGEPGDQRPGDGDGPQRHQRRQTNPSCVHPLSMRLVAGVGYPGGLAS